MQILTGHVHQDEPCWGLKLEPVLSSMPDGSRQWRWVRKVFVVRGDAIAKHETDLGPHRAEEGISPLNIISFGDETVAECLEEAERHCVDTYWRKRLRDMQEASTLMTDLAEQQDKLSRVIANRSLSGPYGTNQRNGYSRITTQRKLMERKRRVTGKVQK